MKFCTAKKAKVSSMMLNFTVAQNLEINGAKLADWSISIQSRGIGSMTNPVHCKTEPSQLPQPSNMVNQQ